MMAISQQQSTRILTVHGDAMEPTLRPGDRVAVQPHRGALHIGALYVFLSVGRCLSIRRVGVTSERTLQLESDAGLEPIAYDPDCRDMEVVGHISHIIQDL